MYYIYRRNNSVCERQREKDIILEIIIKIRLRFKAWPELIFLSI